MSEAVEEFEEEVENLDAEIAEEFEVEAKEAETKARTQGWAPKEEWRGPEEQWVDAETFLERGKEKNAILRERNDRLLEEVTSLKEELKSSVREFGDAQRKAEERAYEKARRDILAQQKQAVELGDVEEWQRLEDSKLELEEEKPKPKQDAEAPYDPDNDPHFMGWLPNNEWYNAKSDKYDIDMAAYAEQIAPVVSRKYGNGPEFYEKISEQVRKKFPEKFGNQRRERTPAVESSTTVGGRPKSGKSYDDLPPEAKATCDRYVTQGLMKREDYVSEYFAQ